MTSKWKEIRDRYSKLEIVKMLYIEYIKIGNWGTVANNFGVSHVNMRRIMKITELDNEGYKLKSQADQKLRKLRAEKIANGRKNIERMNRKPKQKKSNEDEIIEFLKEKCDKNIKYDDFLWVAISSKNKNLSTEKWLKYASDIGIKVLL